MFRRIPVAILLGLFFLTGFAATAASQDSPVQKNWAIAQRPADQIIAFVDRVMKAEKDAPGAQEAPVVVLYQQVFADIGLKETKICRNAILSVKDPSILPERALHPFTTSKGEIIAMGAFVYRGGKLIQLHGRELKSIPPDPPRRGQALFSWPDLKPGDVIGWSITVSYPDAIYTRVVPAVTKVPVVRSNFRLVTSGYHAYKIFGRNGEKYDFKLKVEGWKNDMPAEYSASMNYLPAFPDLPLSPPYGADVPAFVIVDVGRYTTLPGVGRGWIPTTGWRRVARHFAFVEEAAGVASVGVIDKARELTASATTDAAKEALIFDFVKNEVKSARGPEYDRFSQREAPEVLKSMVASDAEKILLMESLLQAVKLDGRIAGVRRQEYGALNTDLPGYQNFTDFAVRCGEDDPRWYVPYADDATAGKLPPSWGRCIVLSPVAGLMQQAFEFNMKVQQKMSEAYQEDAMALANVDDLIERVDRAAKKEKWYRLEKVGGN